MFFRQKGKPKRKSKYKILDATDQESLELKPTCRAGMALGCRWGPTLLSALETAVPGPPAVLHGLCRNPPLSLVPLQSCTVRAETHRCP